jgi:hypothetical protein
MLEHSPAVQVTLSDLALAASSISTAAADDESAVRDVVRELRATIDRVLRLSPPDDPACELLLELQDLLACVEAVDPIKSMLAGIESMARELYGDSWRSVSLSLAHVEQHPRRSSSDPYAFTAVTFWRPTPAQAEVEVYIASEQFGPAAYAALPALLLHECICHVPARQDRVENTSEFAEGFLDWAAHYFLMRWMGALDPLLAPAARVHAEKLKNVLLSGGVDVVATAARMNGHRAADELLAWFEQHCGLGYEESLMRVARLAVELNQIDRPLDAKDHFVSQLSRPLPPHLEQILEQWVRGRASSDLLLLSAAMDAR